MDFADYAPVRKAEAAATQALAGGVGAAPAPEIAAAPVAPVPTAAERILAAIPAPALRFVGGRVRERTFVLDYPIAYGDRVYDAITLRRPTSAEVGAYFERLAAEAASDPDSEAALPIFFDDAGDPIPGEVVKFLDGDDDERIGGAVADFLPPRLRRFMAALQPVSLPTAGVNTEPTSST